MSWEPPHRPCLRLDSIHLVFCDILSIWWFRAGLHRSSFKPLPLLFPSPSHSSCMCDVKQLEASSVKLTVRNKSFFSLMSESCRPKHQAWAGTGENWGELGRTGGWGGGARSRQMCLTRLEHGGKTIARLPSGHFAKQQCSSNVHHCVFALYPQLIRVVILPSLEQWGKVGANVPQTRVVKSAASGEFAS